MFANGWIEVGILLFGIGINWGSLYTTVKHLSVKVDKLENKILNHIEEKK